MALQAKGPGRHRGDFRGIWGLHVAARSVLILEHTKGTPKNFCNKDFAELSGELSGAICLKTHVLMGDDQ